jgi:hypothetical protein
MGAQVGDHQVGGRLKLVNLAPPRHTPTVRFRTVHVTIQPLAPPIRDLTLR